MAFFLSPVLNEQQFDANGNPLAGGQIETYLAGTTTPVTTYKTSTGTAQSNPIILDSSGNYPTGTQLWLDGGKVYKFIVKTSAGVTLRTIDNITPINDTSSAADEWVQYTETAFTYLSATSFSVVGDQANIFQTNRRVKTTNTGGAAYSTIVSAVYGAPNTVVTVANTSGALDSGLSAVYYGLLSATNDSIPGTVAKLASPVFTGDPQAPTANTADNDSSIATTAFSRNTAPQLRSFTATVAANALTVTLPPSAIDFRSATLGTGAVSQRGNSANVTLTVPSTATLGTTSALQSRLQVLAIDNAGTIELAIVNASTGQNLDETSLISTTQITAASNSASTIYSATARSNVPFRFLGYIESTQATAGTWATAPSKVQPAGGNNEWAAPFQSMVRLHTANGYGSTNTVIKRYSTVVTNAGSDITYADSATLGASFAIVNSGTYAISISQNSGGTFECGVSLNSAQLTTNISGITAANRLGYSNGSNAANSFAITMYLTAGDVIRPHSNGAATGTAANEQFTITRVA